MAIIQFGFFRRNFRGSSVTLKATPAEGYDFAGWYVNDNLVSEEATYTFTADKAVKVVAKFTEKATDEPGDNPSDNPGDQPTDDPTDNQTDEPSDNPTDDNPFADVQPSDYYFNPVVWAVAKGITTGTSATTFSPDANCTRAQMVTFLWRAAGSPEPTSANNPFVDVSSDAYYYKAVLWAAEKGITTGTSDTTFSPDDTVNRAQSVTFLWRMEGSPTATATNPFGDLEDGAYYVGAVLWAVQDQVTTGKTTTSFAPKDACIRAQIVTFLYRDLEGNRAKS